MTRHQSFKRLVRTRMAKTGESYTAARATLLAAREPDAGPRPALATSDEMIRQRTGRGWEEWFDLLDGAGLAERPHRDIARWVAELLGVVPLAWAAQAVTVSYERARGGRVVGQRPDGFAITASRMVGIPVSRLFDAFAGEAKRSVVVGSRTRSCVSAARRSPGRLASTGATAGPASTSRSKPGVRRGVP